MRDIHADRILILDFGSQLTQLIARRVRESGVYCEILPWDLEPAELADFGASGIILSGGPESTTVDAAPAVSPRSVRYAAFDVRNLASCRRSSCRRTVARSAPYSSGHPPATAAAAFRSL